MWYNVLKYLDMPERLAPGLPEAYNEQLLANFDAELVVQANTIYQALLPHQPGETIDYVSIDGWNIQSAQAAPSTEAARPPVLFYVPGFTEGIVSKVPFAMAL